MSADRLKQIGTRFLVGLAINNEEQLFAVVRGWLRRRQRGRNLVRKGFLPLDRDANRSKTKAYSPEAPHSYRFPAPLRDGIIISRPNRFIMLVKARGRTLRCHCPTTGRLGDLELGGLPCLYSSASSTKRKTACTVEAISVSPAKGSWVGINQTAANRYFEFFLRTGALSRMASGPLRREVRLGASRIDFLVGDTYVEVKTPLTTLPGGEAGRVGPSRFDSFDRLVRHLRELRRSMATGRRAVLALCYLYDAQPFRPPPPDGTNSRILQAARRAEEAGVERWQVNLRVDREGVSLIRYFRNGP